MSIMAPVTPTGVPHVLTAGDSWRWRIPDLADYPQSEGWVLKYKLAGVDVLSLTPTFQVSGDDVDHWLVAVTAAATAVLEAGRYQLVAWVEGASTYAGRVERLGQSVVELLPDPRTVAAGDLQTHAERTLAVIEAALEGRLASDLESYQIAGRAINKIPIAELVALRATYAAKVRQERGKGMRRHLVSFPHA
jgi:hypothetical protein